jgi:C4-dicarboxylate transporter/malic acid transport protein
MDPSGAFTHCQAQLQSSHSNLPCDGRVIHSKDVKDLEKQIHDRNNRGWRRIGLNFTPSWFAVTMGTGITSILLHDLPYNSPWLYWLSVAVFCLNILLFTTFLAISILRYLIFPGLFMAMLRHPVQSLFLGTFPMGLATIVNMVVFVCVPAWGQWATTLAWTLWWIDVVIAVTICFSLPFIIMTVHESELSKMSALWLLPIVSTIVAAASGGIVAEVLPSPHHALWTIMVSYILFGTGFPLAMVVLVMYFHRLTIHRLPAREVIVSVFLPLGPLGQGSFALMQLGRVSQKTFPLTDTLNPSAGTTFYNLGAALALILWGYGLVWLFFAVASISRTRFPFNMGWWGFTFPLGVYTVATTTLARELPSGFFKVLGTIFSVAVVMLWLGISFQTTRLAATGKIFFAPCVETYEKNRAAAEARKSSVQ